VPITSIADTNANGAIHVFFGISRTELPGWEAWLLQKGLRLGKEDLEIRQRRRFTSATLMAICWKWLQLVCGASSKVPTRMTGEMSHFTH
jgi:hypothetical protein